MQKKTQLFRFQIKQKEAIFFTFACFEDTSVSYNDDIPLYIIQHPNTRVDSNATLNKNIRLHVCVIFDLGVFCSLPTNLLSSSFLRFHDVCIYIIEYIHLFPCFEKRETTNDHHTKTGVMQKV